MATIKRREFIKTAMFACPFLAAGAPGSQLPPPKKAVTGYAVLKAKCDGCGDCLQACPVDAISLKDDVAVIDDDECIECGACVDECPIEAIVEKKDLPKDPNEEVRQETPAAAFSVAGLWVMSGTFADGKSSAPEAIRFVGTAAAGTLQSSGLGGNQGSYSVQGAVIELRLPGGMIVRGRVVSTDRMEGALPNGRWRAERKK